MLHAILILDPTNFPIFEYFVSKDQITDMIATIENNNGTNAHYSSNEIYYREVRLDPKFRMVLVSTHSEIPLEIEENLPKIGENILNGDKVTLQQVLQTSKIEQLSYLR